MYPTYDVYRLAAVRAGNAWKSRRAPRKKISLARSILDAIGSGAGCRTLPPSYLDEVMRELRQYPSYWLLLPFSATKPYGFVELWNNFPWRRQRTIVKVLVKLAHRAPRVKNGRLVSPEPGLDAALQYFTQEVGTLIA